MDLVEIAQDGLSFLTKSNSNHDARGRFSNGFDSDQFGVAANRRNHDRALEIANHHLDALSRELDAAARTAHSQDGDRDEKLAAHAKAIDRHVKKTHQAFETADAIRSEEGFGEVDASDHDVELLEDAPGTAETIREHLGTLKSLRADLKDRLSKPAKLDDDLRDQLNRLLVG